MLRRRWTKVILQRPAIRSRRDRLQSSKSLRSFADLPHLCRTKALAFPVQCRSKARKSRGLHGVRRQCVGVGLGEVRPDETIAPGEDLHREQLREATVLFPLD